ncbi:MAG: M20 family metallo-hydrolase [Austwickia sp.]|nr:M20 family metallo-hydrolase [Actinomycetota bacterium]MCB1253594.1 M20 family metallo-hydrolase [Austwickia sp.]MCO5308991.1 M20 family metallo-hydrolase [Austwickia sp.]
MTSPSLDARIDPDRLWRSLAAVSAFGGTDDGGLHRLAATADDGRARDLVVAAARSAGCAVRVDRVGNVFCRRPGTDPEAAAVLMGSHLDSQPRAGRYDGVYGVMAGLEVLTALGAAGEPTRRPVELAIWTNEEGARFPPAMMGSAVFAGRLSPEEALATRDAEGIALGEALSRIGYAGAHDVLTQEFAAYLEAHIEQGPILEAAGLRIGVVTGAQAQYWLDVQLHGVRGHAGTFPMESRADALVAAAELVLAVRRVGLARPEVGRATVGRLEVPDSAPNVVPSLVRLTVELRHPQAEELAAMLAEVRSELERVCETYGVSATSDLTLQAAPTPFDAEVVAVVEAAAQTLGLSRQRMISGAGHDAVPLASVIPTGMIFVPCVAGVSHSPRERLDPQAAADGAAVLLESVRRLAH